MEKIRRVIIVLFFTILLIFFFAGLQVITGNTISINKNTLTQKNEMTKLEIFPKIIRIEKIGSIIVKDNLGVILTPGSSGAYKKIEFFKKGSSEGFEEFNIKYQNKCIGSKCISKDGSKITASKVIDAVKWKTGTYTARVKDAATLKYVTAEFKVENNL